MNFLCKSILTDTQWGQKFYSQYFAGMNWGEISFAHKNSLVVVYNFDIICIIVAPKKTDAPLIINADTMLSGSIIVQGLQTVSWRGAQIVKLPGSI